MGRRERIGEGTWQRRFFKAEDDIWRKGKCKEKGGARE